MLIRAVLLLAMGFGADGAAAHDPQLPAEDLFFEERSETRRFTWTIDPLLARYPDIVRALRAESLPESRLSEDNCVEPMPCYRLVRHERGFAGERLVSIFTEQEGYYGGAHGGSSAEHRIWDRKEGRWIPFGDLFRSWPEAQALLQQRFCANLNEMREDEVECASLDELALGFHEGSELPVGMRAGAFEFRTSDYQLGSYAQGRVNIRVAIDEAILALIRPEYRADFAAADY
jgi:hypothetical protein